MSEETEVVAGEIKAILQRAADKWQVEVQPSGSNYTKKLWTKDAEVIAGLSSRLGENERFLCNASHWTNSEGRDVRSLWIHQVGGDLPMTSTGAPVSVSGGGGGTSARPEFQRELSPEAQARIEKHQVRELKAEAWRTAAALFVHEDIPDISGMTALYGRLKLFQSMVLSDIAGDLVTYEESQDVPFD